MGVWLSSCPRAGLNNASDKYIRDFIKERARILAVVGLHQNTFKPHTGTKTSVLFLQKWNEDSAQGPLCPRVEDYPIFTAVSERGGKDNSGDYVYIRSASDQYQLDRYGHLVVDHDLHSHDGALPAGIADVFIQWAEGQGLSFWPAAEAAAATRRQAGLELVRYNRSRQIYVDPDADINELIDEMNEMSEVVGA